ncbi:MAG: redoxin domain-containing protein [Hyphomicrobiaceae bacterium]|nr:redoxin domain-containing protein [Hyphomicrobiaceae bacterium]
MEPEPAPALQVSQWLNTEQPLMLDSLRGRVVVIECFQMLCPGCVTHGLPQAMRVHQEFDPSLVTVIGLHTVFEHHEAMQPHALEVFCHEYRITFPVGIDQPDDASGIPLTMRAYQTQGTPTLILIDKLGRRRIQYLGGVSDIRLGADIMSLSLESG